MKFHSLRYLILLVLWLAPLLTTGWSVSAAPSLQGEVEKLLAVEGDCDALNQAGAELYRRGRYPEALQKLEAALVCYRDVPAGDQAGEGSVLTYIGQVYYGQGRYAEALDSYQQALELLHNVPADNRAGEAVALNGVGLVYWAQGRYAEALDSHQQALGIVQEVDDRAEEGVTLGGIGEVYFAQGHYVEALENFQQALAIHREMNNQAGEAITLDNIGEVYFAQARYNEALEKFEPALAIQRDAQVRDRAGEGTTLNNIGVAYGAQGRYAEALAYLQESLAIHREVGDRAEEGITLANIGVIYSSQGHHTNAFESLQQALNILQEVGHRAWTGVTIHNIGNMYANQLRFGEALGSFEQALAIFQEIEYRAGQENTFLNMGFAYQFQGRSAEALESFQQALTGARRVGNQLVEQLAFIGIVAMGGTPPDDAGPAEDDQENYDEILQIIQDRIPIQSEVSDLTGEGMIFTYKGSVAYAQGRYTEALDSFQQALIIHREAGNRLAEEVTLIGIGTVFQAQGRYTRALETYQQALIIDQEVDYPAGAPTILNGIGLAYWTQGRYAEALDSFQRGLTAAREVDYRAGEGNTLNNIGGVYVSQGRYAQALDSFQQTLAIQREIKNRLAEPTTLNNIGEVYAAQGRYAEALATYQQARSIQQEVDDRGGEGTTLNNIGAVYISQGRHAEALGSLQEALIIHREAGNRPMEGTALDNIGVVYANQGRYDEALKSYKEALVILQEVGNQSMAGTTLNNIGVVYANQGRYAKALVTYQHALDIQQEIGDRVGEANTLDNIGAAYGSQEHYTEAFRHYQQAIDILETVRVVAGSEQGRAAFIAQHAELYARAAGLFHQQGQDEEAFFISERGRARAFLDSLATGQVELTDNEAAELLVQEQEVYAQRQSIQDNLAKARALNPPDPDLVADLETQLTEAKAAYAEIQGAIIARSDQLADLIPGRSKNVLGVSEVQELLDQQTTLVSYYVLQDETLAFLITPNDFQTITLDVSREELSEGIQNFRNFATIDEAHPDNVITLYQWLIEPLKEHIDTPHLTIIPHQQLHYLPFAALTDGDRYLIDDYVLTTLPSASTLPFIQDKTSRDLTNPLILGKPATDVEGLSLLLFAKQESETIAGLYDVEPLLDGKGTEQAVWEKVAEAGILHLAAHGKFNTANPLYSTLYLAPSGDDSDSQSDGRLEAHEIYGLNLNKAGLVVLSACETQVGELSAGDEVVGLTRAFFFAGTPSVIASLWAVEDEATSLLMERFYTHLKKDGMGKAEALRQAQIEVREAYPNPYYWSGFVLSGDGEEINPPLIPVQTDSEKVEPIEAVAAEGEETGQPKEPEPPSPIIAFDLFNGFGTLPILGLLSGLLLLGGILGVISWYRSRQSLQFVAQEISRNFVTRYTDIVCPRQVWLQTSRISVVIRLTIKPSAYSEAVKKLELSQDLPVRVRIDAPAFDVLNEIEQETIIRPETDSLPIVFDLCPHRAGPTRVTLDFFQEGNPVGTVSLPVEITLYPVSSATEEPPSKQPLHIETDITPPDLLLYISHESFSEQPALVFTLIRSGEVGRTFPPIRLHGNPATHAKHLYRQLTVLTGQADPALEQVSGEWRGQLHLIILQNRLYAKFSKIFWRVCGIIEIFIIFADCTRPNKYTTIFDYFVSNLNCLVIFCKIGFLLTIKMRLPWVSGELCL